MSAPLDPKLFAEYQKDLAALRKMDPRLRKQALDLEHLYEEMASTSLLHFSAFTWLDPDPYVTGRHTREICARLDRAVEDYRKGKSTYLIVTVPFRNGKSQIVSRAFPPYAFGRLQDLQPEMILATHGQGLSDDMSRDAQDIIRSEDYRQLFPNVKIDPRKAGVQQWRILGSRSKLNATGLGGGFIGKGANILIVDDYLAGREEAESEAYRKSSWEGFTDLFTRLGPVHIVVILATRWHVDDVIGRIKNRNNPDHEDYEASYPKYEIMHYKALQDDGTYLFLERYPKEWYEAQFGTLSPYRIAAELQGEPTLPGGNMLKVDKIHFNAEMPDDLVYNRGWDLASSKEERTGDDPDYTFGICLAVRITAIRDLMGNQIRDSEGEPMYKYVIYIEDGKYCKEEATARDKMIRQAAHEDGPEVWQGIESVGGYKDKFTTMRDIMAGVRVIRKIHRHSDKVTYASKLEPVFAAGNVYIGAPKTKPWVRLLIQQLSQFPDGVHDDAVDALYNAFELSVTRWRESGGLDGGDFAQNAV